MTFNAINSLRFPLNEILGTKTSVHLLRALFIHGSTLSTGDLRRRTGLSHKSITMTLSHLEHCNLLKVHGSMRTRLFEINQHHPLADLLKNLFENETALFEQIIDEIRTIFHRLKPDTVEALWLYSNIITDNQQTKSDFHLIIYSNQNQKLMEEELFEEAFLEEIGQIEDHFGLTFSVERMGLLDIVFAEKSQNEWWLKLKKDAFSIIGTSPLEVWFTSQ